MWDLTITTANIVATVSILVTVWLVTSFSKKLNVTLEKVHLFKTVWLDDMGKIEQALENLVSYNIFQKPTKINEEYEKHPLLLVTDIGDRITSLNKSIIKNYSYTHKKNEIKENFEKADNAYISFKKVFTQYTEPKKVQRHANRIKLAKELQKETKKFKVSLRNYKYSIINL